MSKNEAVLKQFTDFCKANPELRFWQALRAFSGENFIIVADEIDHERMDIRGWTDTFYWEGINE